MASEHTVGFDPAEQLAKDRESLRRRFWIKLKRVIARLPFAEDLLAAYYCAFDRQTPGHVRVALLGFARPFAAGRPGARSRAGDSRPAPFDDTAVRRLGGAGAATSGVRRARSTPRRASPGAPWARCSTTGCS